MNFLDHTATPLANVKMTAEGYLVADAFAVRTGVQQYLGSEVGRPDLRLVNVYRPEDAVFSKDSVATFAHAPITVDHPTGGVDAASWREKAVGEVSTEAMRDGERLRLQLVIKDAAAAKLVQDGSKRQLSAGYQCELDWKDGVAPDGTPYQAVQKNIRINHLALVEQGRAGNCQIGDSAWVSPIADATGVPPQPKEVVMTMKTIVMGDKAVSVLADDAQSITDHVAKLQADNAKITTDLETLKGEKAALEKKLEDSAMTPAKLQALVADRARTTAGYKALTGKDAPTDLADADLRKAAVAVKLGDAAVVAMSDEAIAGAFRAFTADVKAPDPLQTAAHQGIQHNDAAPNLDHIFAASGVAMKKDA